MNIYEYKYGGDMYISEVIPIHILNSRFQTKRISILYTCIYIYI